MHKTFRSLVLLILSILAGYAHEAVAQQKEADDAAVEVTADSKKEPSRPAGNVGEPISLFDGQTLAGWTTQDGQPITDGWIVEDGAICRANRGGNILFDSEVGDFELTFEWKIVAGGNSGLKYRVQKYGGKLLGCEYQLLGEKNRSLSKSSCGALYALYEPAETKHVNAVGQWNSAKIVAHGPTIEHWLNGEKIVEADLNSQEWRKRLAASKFAPHDDFARNTMGRIMLTDHGSRAWYRNLVLTPLPNEAIQTPASLVADRPNVLFIIADDASRHYGQAYGCDWVKTPNIDRLAKAGLVFDNAYVPTSKCAPCRAAILTGRNPWQLEDAANHQPYFPARFLAFSEALAKAGVACGGAGKTWGPGEAKTAAGQSRDFALGKAASSKGGADPGAGLTAFLETRAEGKPFFYWFGSSNPHRGYKLDAGIAAGKKPADIDHVPAYWPDNEIVRRDMLDYAMEVEAFDAQVGSLIHALEASGEVANTLVIVTSDHGMPFPRVKGHTFDDAHRIPFVASWPDGIVEPGRRVADFISFIDLAPTFLALMGVDGETAGMAPITGRSFVDLLKNEHEYERPFVIVGRERNDVLCRPGSPAGLGYPARAIRQGDYFYVHNFAPERWPCGNPEIGFKDTDASPTKKLIEDRGPADPYWQQAFGKRPAEQLFDLSKDPDCVNNLAADPEFAAKVTALREELLAELKRQHDPRVLGQGDVFDNYLSPRAKAPADRPEKKKKKSA